MKTPRAPWGTADGVGSASVVTDVVIDCRDCQAFEADLIGTGQSRWPRPGCGRRRVRRAGMTPKRIVGLMLFVTIYEISREIAFAFFRG